MKKEERKKGETFLRSSEELSGHNHDNGCCVKRKLLALALQGENGKKQEPPSYMGQIKNRGQRLVHAESLTLGLRQLL